MNWGHIDRNAIATKLPGTKFDIELSELHTRSVNVVHSPIPTPPGTPELPVTKSLRPFRWTSAIPDRFLVLFPAATLLL